MWVVYSLFSLYWQWYQELTVPGSQTLWEISFTGSSLNCRFMLVRLGGNIFCMRSWRVLHVSYILAILHVEYWSPLHWKKNQLFPMCTFRCFCCSQKCSLFFIWIQHWLVKWLSESTTYIPAPVLKYLWEWGKEQYNLTTHRHFLNHQKLY